MKTTQEEMLSSAQFQPVFNPNGEFEGITQLKIATDRRQGFRAMEELVNTNAAGDHITTSDGWTTKQLRILDMPAPPACHYLKPSRKYDAATGDMVHSITILLPYEVVWRLFETLFFGQFSVNVASVETTSEDVMPVGNSEAGPSQDAPGRIFYSRAVVNITLHLNDGKTRTYSGVGVAYDHVRTHKTGNVFSINSAHRTTEKGAVSDAKREAISTIGRVFRRAYEDGDEMIQKFEDELVKRILQNNKGAVKQKIETSASAPAPKSRTAPVEKVQSYPSEDPGAGMEDISFSQLASGVEAEAQTHIPKDVSEQPSETESTPNTYALFDKAGVETQVCDPDEFFDAVAEMLSYEDDVDAIKVILSKHKEDLKLAESNSKQGNEFSILEEMAIASAGIDAPQVADEAPETKEKSPVEAEDKGANTVASENEWEISVDKLTGNKILSAYEAKFQTATKPADVDRILEANTEFAKRLTKAQKGTLFSITSKAKSKF